MQLAEFRKQYPQYNDLDDEALTDSLHKKFYKDVPREKFNEQIGYAPEKGIFATAKESLFRGGHQLKGIGGGLLSLAGEAVGLDDLADYGLDVYTESMEDAKEYEAEVGSFRNIESFGDAGTYAVEAIFENLPMFLPSLVTGGVGAMVARKGAETLVKKLVSDQVSKGVGKEAAERAAVKAVQKRVTIGAAAGAYPSAAGIEAGSIYGEIYDETGERRPGIASTGGAVAGAFDTIPSVALIKRALGPIGDKVLKRYVGRVGIAVAEQALLEAPTEAIQTVIEKVSLKAAAPETEVFSKESIDEIIDAALKGGIAGGTLGGGVSAVSEARGGAPATVEAAQPGAEAAPLQPGGAGTAPTLQPSAPPLAPAVTPLQPGGPPLETVAIPEFLLPQPSAAPVPPGPLPPQSGATPVPEPLQPQPAPESPIIGAAPASAPLQPGADIQELPPDMGVSRETVTAPPPGASGEMILRTDGQPFKSRGGALMAARNRKLQNIEPTEVDGGWALSPVEAPSPALVAEAPAQADAIQPAIAQAPALSPSVAPVDEPALPPGQEAGPPTLTPEHGAEVAVLVQSGVSPEDAVLRVVEAGQGLPPADPLSPTPPADAIAPVDEPSAAITPEQPPDVTPPVAPEDIKVEPVSVNDTYQGEMFGTKVLRVDGIGQAIADINILEDEVSIRNIETGSDVRGKGYAKKLVDDIFNEFPGKKIVITNTTEDGAGFFEKNYDVDEDQRIYPKGAKPPPPTTEQVETKRADPEQPAEVLPEPVVRSNGKPFSTEKGAAMAARFRKIEAEPVAVEGGFALREKAPEEVAEEVDAAANEAATSPLNDKPEPTQAQAKAGQYEKGDVKLHGLDIAIENPKGSERKGVGKDGEEWSVTMPSHYGFARKTEGADGDQVDVYVGPRAGRQRPFMLLIRWTQTPRNIDEA